jgi:hypothetical protein
LEAAENKSEPFNLRSDHAGLLRNLQEAHERLISEIANLGELTRHPEVDWPTFCAARWRVSEASLVRRTLVARITDYLLPIVGEDDRAALKGLTAADQTMLRFSAEHVRLWPLKAIQNDWSGYCTHSRLIRSRMTDSLKAEQRVLIPMLKAGSPAHLRAPHRAGVAQDQRVRLIR